MGEEDTHRQAPNVARMKLLGAEVVPVMAGTRTLKEAVNEALRDWAASVRNTHYIIGSVVGPHPFPVLVRDLQRVIGDEARAQYAERLGGDPDVVRGVRRRRQQRDRDVHRVRGRARRPADRRRGRRARLAARRALLVAHAGPAGDPARRAQLPAPGRGRSGRRHAFDLGRPRLPGRRSRARVPARMPGSRTTSRPPTTRRSRGSRRWPGPRASSRRSSRRTSSDGC